MSWKEAQHKIFEILKKVIATAPILYIVDPNEPFVLETDTSNEAICTMLVQRGHPIAFENKKLHGVQCKYSPFERELLVIVHVLKKWRHYL